MTRNSAVSCCVCVEYENFDFLRITISFIKANNLFFSH